MNEVSSPLPVNNYRIHHGSVSRNFSLAVGMVLWCCNASAAETPDLSKTSAATCLPEELVKNSEIIFLGMHENMGTWLPYSFPKTRNVVKAVAVAGHLSRPTIIILAASNPAVWDLSGVLGQSIKGIYVSGWHRQGVTGVSKNVPIIFRHWTGNLMGGLPAKDPCPNLRSPNNRAYAQASAIRIRKAFGKWPTDFYGSYAPFSFAIGSVPLPPHAKIPKLEEIVAQDPMVMGDAKVQEDSADMLSVYNDPERAGQIRAELEGRRLLHIRWNSEGDVVEVEKELFGKNYLLEQISKD